MFHECTLECQLKLPKATSAYKELNIGHCHTFQPLVAWVKLIYRPYLLLDIILSLSTTLPLAVCLVACLKVEKGLTQDPPTLHHQQLFHPSSLEVLECSCNSSWSPHHF